MKYKDPFLGEIELVLLSQILMFEGFYNIYTDKWGGYYIEASTNDLHNETKMIYLRKELVDKIFELKRDAKIN